MAKPRFKVPETATAGDIITIKTIVSHRMESGHRKDADGNLVPRQIINFFQCEFNGRRIFSCDLHTAVSANPYFEFNARVEEAGIFKFTWIDDDGTVTEAEQSIALK